MTVFEKLNEARLRFQNAGVKKSGHNKFAGYTYYELADILPFINQIANDDGTMPRSQKSAIARNGGYCGKVSD